MLMQIRLMIGAVTLVLLPRDSFKFGPLTLVLSMVALSWLSGRNWRLVTSLVTRHPLLFTLDMCASFLVLGIGGISGPFLLATVVTAAVAGLLYRWPGMLAVAALQIACYYVTFAFTPELGEDGSFQALLGQPLFYPLAGFAGVALRRLLDEHAATESARRHAEVLAAAAQERARLAREMHDSLAKTLRGVALAASALPLWVCRDADRAVTEAGQIAAATEIASRQARILLSELRDDSAIRPLPEVLQDLAQRWADDNGAAVTCETDEQIDLPLRVRHEVVAILGEALTNAERHARAHSVRIRLSRDEDGVVLSVQDDGQGFEIPELVDLARDGHYGLVGLYERAERVGGTLTVHSKPGNGTTVTARLPSAEPAEPSLAEVS
ncbi:sensor histidine kinase [Spirillospora sp. NPDC047279]|uniref:sensor histidine kinase n=1 Tax=Spirillospora sp. NPDC047279 TaxID=3155478 RepID=UPI0033CB3C35